MKAPAKICQPHWIVILVRLDHGYMKRRFARINDLLIKQSDRKFRWSAKPDGHSGGPSSIAFANASWTTFSGGMSELSTQTTLPSCQKTIVTSLT